MTTPRLEACYFAIDGRGDVSTSWMRLARVLSITATEHCHDWHVTVQRLPAPQRRAVADGMLANTHKLDTWCRLVEEAEDGARLLLIDADTMIIRSLDPVWDHEFDLAYTTRVARFPFNAGVIFVRVSEPLRAFFRIWRDRNRQMLVDGGLHATWRRKYGGLNQAALGSLFEQGFASTLRVAKLPCVEWNCEDSCWSSFDPNVTRIVHVKSSLRKMVLGTLALEKSLVPLVARWRALDARELQETA